ncbi:MAG: Transposase [Planctomycetaceae bacterium]|nr:Transposase [Planctomycetaceae bacterium]
MTTSSETPRSERKHPAHGIRLIDGQPTVIFDTVCTKDRHPWLATREVHSLLIEVWESAEAWLMGRYVIMPDHIHFFSWYVGSAIEYDKWVQFWKSQFSKKFKRKHCRWLTDAWDTRVRSALVYEEKWLYVLNNPVRQGLVERPEDWPYQGEINKLLWP